MISGREMRRGFSLLELVVVVAVILVVAAMATPAILSAMNDYKLRTAASSFAGVIHKTRMQAVSDDRWYTVARGNSGGSDYAFADLNNNAALDAVEQNLIAYLPRGIVFDAAGGPSLATMNLEVTPVTGLPAFNARGLPCTPTGGTCPVIPPGGGAQRGYIYYLRQDRSLGRPAWAAVTVSAAGRVRAWTWSGNAWN